MRVLLLTLIGSLLIATVTTVGAVAFFNLRASIDVIFESRFQEISRGATERVQAMLEPALAILRECDTKARRGLLHVNEPDVLVEQLAERLRYQTALTWLSYGDEQGQFAGARRHDDGRIIINRSWLIPGGGKMREDFIDPDGMREEHREQTDDGEKAYDPRKRPFYQLASTSNDPVWTEPYPWWAEEGFGITCAMALRMDGKVKGVFTADFRIDSISDFLESLRIGETDQTYVINQRQDDQEEVTIIAGPVTRRLPHGTLDVAIGNLPVPLSDLRPGDPKSISFSLGDEQYWAAFEAIPLSGGIQWVTVVVVPQRELLEKVRRNTRWTVAIGIVLLIAALLLGNVLSQRFIRPLQQITDDLERIAHFDLSSDELPPTQVREIQIVGETTERMKASLRSFSRYVPTDLVRQFLSRGTEARLGARAEVLTICFIDIEGFSKISEHSSPEELVERLGVYFDAVSNMLTTHGGTIDKFIGDGMLAFFNAPNPLENHPVHACHAALAVQAILRKLNAFWAQQQKPVFRSRIGLHTGEVFVGNIGTPARFAYTVVGDGVNLADALESLNKVYGTSILVSEEVHDAGGEQFEWRRIDRVAVKGRAKGGFVFELIGVKGAVEPELIAARDRYESALNDYFNRRFYDAIIGFHEALDQNPKDRAAQILLTRCRVLAQSPPPAEWTGTYVHSPG
jgi:adenylate cyclase